jgi:hypothetical protein
MYTVHYSRHILIKLDFLYIFSKNPQILNFIKIRVVGTESVDADGQTRQSQYPLFEISRRRLKKSLKLLTDLSPQLSLCTK